MLALLGSFFNTLSTIGATAANALASEAGGTIGNIVANPGTSALTVGGTALGLAGLGALDPRQAAGGQGTTGQAATPSVPQAQPATSPTQMLQTLNPADTVSSRGAAGSQIAQRIAQELPVIQRSGMGPAAMGWQIAKIVMSADSNTARMADTLDSLIGKIGDDANMQQVPKVFEDVRSGKRSVSNGMASLANLGQLPSTAEGAVAMYKSLVDIQDMNNEQYRKMWEHLGKVQDVAHKYIMNPLQEQEQSNKTAMSNIDASNYAEVKGYEKETKKGEAAKATAESPFVESTAEENYRTKVAGRLQEEGKVAQYVPSPEEIAMFNNRYGPSVSTQARDRYFSILRGYQGAKSNPNIDAAGIHQSMPGSLMDLALNVSPVSAAQREFEESTGMQPVNGGQGGQGFNQGGHQEEMVPIFDLNGTPALVPKSKYYDALQMGAKPRKVM